MTARRLLEICLTVFFLVSGSFAAPALPGNLATWDPATVEVTVEQGRSIDVDVGLRLDLPESEVSFRTRKRLARITPSTSTGWQAGEARSLTLRLHVPGNKKVGRKIRLRVAARNQSGKFIRHKLPVVVHVAALQPDQLPMSPSTVEVGDPASPTTVATAEYTGTIELPPDAGISARSLVIRGGIEQLAAIDPPPGDVSVPTARSGSAWDFALRMNTQGTALIAATKRSGEAVLLAVFPKHPDLTQVNPRLDSVSTAEALIFSYPGVLLDDPLLAALVLRVIQSLPETQTLADLLARKMMDDPTIATHPDSEVLGGIQGALSALANFEVPSLPGGTRLLATTKAQSGVCPWRPDSCDAATRYLYHAAVSTDDNLCLTITRPLDPDTLAGRLGTTNFSGRWVFHYIDDDASVTPPESISDGFTGVSFPRQYAIPSTFSILIDIFDALKSGLWNSVFRTDSNGVAQEVVVKIQEKARLYIDPQESSFELLPLVRQQYTVTSVGGWGSGFLTDWQWRMAVPFAMTVVSQALFPAISVALDLGENLTFPSHLEATKDLLESFARDAIGDLALSVQAFTNPEASFNDKLKALAEVGLGLLQNREFLAWLSRTGWGIITTRISEGTAKLFVEHLLFPVRIVNAGADVINLGLSIGDLILCASQVDVLDTYNLDLRDEDGDGYTWINDCDDSNELVHPGASELCDDTIDNNCNGKTDCGDTDCFADPACTLARFLDNGDGTISDTQTGLTWEKKSNDGSIHDVDNRYTWAGCCDGNCASEGDYCQPNAAAAAACWTQSGGAVGCGECSSGVCVVDPYGHGAITTIWDWLAQLNSQGGSGFAGHSDWRIPEMNRDGGADELESILLEPFPCGSWPCVDPVFNTSCTGGCTVTTCSCTEEGSSGFPYWSSTAYGDDPFSVWVVVFANARVDWQLKKFGGHIRAVRGGPPHFIDNGDGTITDTETGLMWEKKSDDGSIHDVDNRYTWAGCCDGNCASVSDLCQPSATAAAVCNAQTGGALGCTQCASGTCDVSFGYSSVITTIWDWLAQLNSQGGTGFGGYSDWRVPSEAGRNTAGCGAPWESCPHGVVCPGCEPQELETILYEPYPCGRTPCVDPVFDGNCSGGCTISTCSCTSPGFYWSSTMSPYPERPWDVNFGGGFVDTDLMTDHEILVRAVRGGSTTTTTTPSTTTTTVPTLSEEWTYHFPVPDLQGADFIFGQGLDEIATGGGSCTGAR